MTAAVATTAAILLLVIVPTTTPAAGRPEHVDAERTLLESSVRVIQDAGDRLVVRFSASTSDLWSATAERETASEPVAYRSDGSEQASAIWRASHAGSASFSITLMVPDTGRVESSVVSSSVPGALAGSSIEVSKPAVVRDLRVVNVTFTPPLSGPGETCTVDLAIGAAPERGVNEKTRDLPYLSPAFDRLYRSTVLNYRPEAPAPPSVSFRGVPDGARYLIITADTYASDITDLAEWRHAKGLLTKVVELSEIGSTSQDIRDYVQNAYDTWTVPPEFVLLVGDVEQLPCAVVDHPILTVYTDNYYAMLAGSDVMSDVFVGRISADSHTQCQTQVAKILGYERTPLTGDPNWPLSGTLLLADDYDAGDAVYYANTWHIYDLMEGAAFAPIDTLFDKNGVTQSEVYSAINDGTGFVNFRGVASYNWPSPFDVNPSSVTSGWRLPIVVSSTCYTGAFENDGFLCENWVRAGNAYSPKGGVACFATGTAYWNNIELSLRRGFVDEGFFSNVFDPNGLTLGEACVAGKNYMQQMDPNDEEYDGWNLMGDAAMSLWSGPMHSLYASYDGAVTPGGADLTVTVTDGGRGYVEGALVAAVKDDEAYAWGTTDALGEVTLFVDAATEGSGTLTVTGRNGVPFEGTFDVVTGPHPVLESIVVDDSVGGNGDGYPNPGETVVLLTTLVNAGDATATSVQATWRTQDAYVSIVDSTSSYADMPPDSTSTASSGFEVTISPSCPRGHRLHYSMYVSHSGTNNTLSPSPLTIETGHLGSPVAVVDDAAPGGNGSSTLSPGETAGLSVTLDSDGPCDLADVSATLTSDDPNVIITSPTAFFGDAPTGSSVDNGVVPFVFTVSPSAPGGHSLALDLLVSADGGEYTYTDTLELSFELTGGATLLPSGPDAYGYYVYDQTDGLFGPAPTYDWVDIAPPGPGSLIADVTDADAGLATMSLIWNFGYYGEAYNQISVNSNGFFTMGWTDYRLGDNSPIPDPHGPACMVAPFWDDLDPSAGGDVYRWFDTVDHRWVFQFENVRHWNMPFEETFQVILFHPAYYPTPTGDGQILIQYEEVSLADGCTVGFENSTQDDGIQCLYNGSYDSQMAPIAPGTALLLTTIPPTGSGLPWLVMSDTFIDDSVYGNGNGRAEPGETVVLSIELTNEGGMDAEGVSLTLSSSDGLAAISDGTGTMADLPASATADNTSDPFVLTLSEAVDDTVATLWTEIDANGGGYDGAQRIELHIDLTGTSVAEGDTPSVFRFQPASPNPFTSGTTMRLSLPQPDHATVAVYNVAGRLVRTLVDGKLEAGERTIRWDGRNDSGLRCASGVYLVRVEAGAHRAARKAVLLR